MLALTLPLLLAVQGPDTESLPLLNPSRQNPGPDGNLAIEGVLRKPFCFAAPTKVCVAAGSTVFYTTNTGGRRAPDDDAPPTPIALLRAVDASAPFEAYGISFAAHRPTPAARDQDASTRVYSLEVSGDRVRGVLAKPLSFAGFVVGPGPVELYLDKSVSVVGVAVGKLHVDASAGAFAIPKGSEVALCPDGVQHAAAVKRKPIVKDGERYEAIGATREGDGPTVIAQVPWVCARKLLGHAPTAR